MKDVVTRFLCDVHGCKKEVRETDGGLGITLSVVFTTEQTEGKGVKPYLSQEKMDLCIEHHSKVMDGQMMYASWAQGYNQYYFKDIERSVDRKELHTEIEVIANKYVQDSGSVKKLMLDMESLVLDFVKKC